MSIVTKDDRLAFLTSCITIYAHLGRKSVFAYEIPDPATSILLESETNLNILNWIALCFASHPTSHAAVSLSFIKNHITLHVVTKGESQLRTTAGENGFIQMTQHLLDRVAKPNRGPVDMESDRNIVIENLVSWCWPAFWGKLGALQKTLRQLGVANDGKESYGHLGEVIAKWRTFRNEVGLPFDKASVFDYKVSRSSSKELKGHTPVTEGEFKSIIYAVACMSEPVLGAKSKELLLKDRYAAYFRVIEYCQSLDRCDFIRSSIEAGEMWNPRWVAKIDPNIQSLIDTVFHQLQRIMEYHLGLTNYLIHGLAFFRKALSSTDGGHKKRLTDIFSIDYIPPPHFESLPATIQFKEAPDIWIPKLFTENGIEKLQLSVTDKEKEELIKSCKNLWKVGDVINLSTHSLCEMGYFLTHNKQGFTLELIGTSDIPCAMCAIYMRKLERHSTLRKISCRAEQMKVDRHWTAPPRSSDEMKSIISQTLGHISVSITQFLQRSHLRGMEVNQRALDDLGLTVDDLSLV